MSDMIRKIFSVGQVKAIDEEQGIYEATISTESVDRQGDVVIAAGAKIDNYLKNPVVLWAHTYNEPPIAKTLSLEVMPNVGIKSKFQYPAWGVNERADVVRKLWAGGFLNATSIGFMPSKAEPLTNAEDPSKNSGIKYTEWELLEFSIVPVPANQDALRLAMKSLLGEQAEEKEQEVQTDEEDEVGSTINVDKEHMEPAELDRLAAALKEYFITIEKEFKDE